MSEEATRPGGLQVGIVVRDIEAVTPFYRDGLGLRHLSDSAPSIGLMRRFSCGDGTVKLMQLAEPPSDSNPPGGIRGGSTGLRWFTLIVPDIEEALRRCEAAGGKVAEPIVELENGTRLIMLEDPEGSCWVEVAEHRT